MASPDYGSAIASIESGGNYSILGPETKGDRAYGKYQVLGSNVGPWSKEILGFEMTPQQFLASPQAQDAVFQGKFGQYVDKYGPEGAAQAWFAGPGGVGKLDRKDVLGTSVGAYGAKFMKALGQPVPQAAPTAQASPPVPGLSQGMPAYGWSPNNAPAAVSGAQASPMDAQPAPFDPGQMQMALGGPPRKPPDLSLFHALLQRSPPNPAGFSFSNRG